MRRGTRVTLSKYSLTVSCQVRPKGARHDRAAAAAAVAAQATEDAAFDRARPRARIRGQSGGEALLPKQHRPCGA